MAHRKADPQHTRDFWLASRHSIEMAHTRISPRLLVATLLLSLFPLVGLWSLMRNGPLEREATVLVKKGANLEQMASQLEAQGVIRSAAIFKLWARARRIKPIRGEYTFAPRASLANVEGKLRRGDIHFTTIVITPSAHAWSVQKRLKDFIPEDVFWAMWKSPHLAKVAGFPEAKSLEGLLAPATYKIHHALEPEEIMLQMVEAFRNQVRPRLDGGELPPYATLILASLVERETNLPEELPKVAGVYAQRLRIGMRLQCDPTSLYARWLSGDLRFTPPASDDIHREHPFNTYTVSGLPPTPIAVPGPAAIAAAKAPERTSDLYFVATGTGGHNFAPTLREHNLNVGIFRREVERQRSQKDKKE